MRVSYREEPRLYINMKLSFRPTYREMRVFLNYLIPSPYSVLSVHQLLYSVKTSWLSRSVSWNDAYPPPPCQSRFLFLSVIQRSYWLNFSNSMSDNLWQTLNKRLLFLLCGCQHHFEQSTQKSAANQVFKNQPQNWFQDSLLKFAWFQMNLLQQNLAQLWLSEKLLDDLSFGFGSIIWA